jgi:hypothetical protein
MAPTIIHDQYVARPMGIVKSQDASEEGFFKISLWEPNLR